MFSPGLGGGSEMNWQRATDRQLGEQISRAVNASERPGTVADQLRQLGCDPIVGMANLARDETVPVVLRARLFAELAHYVAPPAKTVDVTGADGGPSEVGTRVNMDALKDQELQTLHDLLIKAGL